MSPITLAYALMTAAIGALLLLFCLHGVCDPYWSRGTRIVSAIGAAVGAATFLFGAAVVMVGS